MTLHRMECLTAMKQMPENSVDSIATDPPYELGFMGKSWDNAGIAYSAEMWSEALRILKPGGHLLAFGGTRTYHRMTCAIEDAGFEIRDSINWIYGSGFPKSHNVSLSIDKMKGHKNRGRAIPTASTFQASDTEQKHKLTSNPVDPYIAKSAESQKWQGWGTALKPAHEPIVLARKPLIGTVAANVLEHGTGALNIDGARIGRVASDVSIAGKRTATFGTQETQSGGDGSGGWKQNDGGRWPANIIFGHDEDCEQVATTEETLTINKLEQWSGFGEKLRPDYQSSSSTVNVAVWKCTPGCAVAELDAQSGVGKDGIAVKRNGRDPERNGYDGGWGAEPRPDSGYGGKGGASRFFYCAKANKSERNAGLDETANIHPTVKPLALMRYLVRLVTPLGGVVFDPFLGSGTTAVASILEGFKWAGCEMTEDYWPIIEARTKWAKEQPPEIKEPTLFERP